MAYDQLSLPRSITGRCVPVCRRSASPSSPSVHCAVLPPDQLHDRSVGFRPSEHSAPDQNFIEGTGAATTSSILLTPTLLEKEPPEADPNMAATPVADDARSSVISAEGTPATASAPLPTLDGEQTSIELNDDLVAALNESKASAVGSRAKRPRRRSHGEHREAAKLRLPAQPLDKFEWILVAAVVALYAIGFYAGWLPLIDQWRKFGPTSVA